MHGNVWEWVEDTWHKGYEGAPADGSAWVKASAKALARRVLRGGSWYDVGEGIRSACRTAADAGDRDSGIGFRCARNY